MGKTSFAMSMAHGVAKNGRPALFFNGEMSNEQLTDRQVSMVSKVDGRKMRTGEFSKKDLEAMFRAAPKLGSIPLHIIRATRMTSGKIRAAVAAFIAKTGERPVVFVDLLNAMREYKTSDRQAMFSDSILGLKDMAVDLNLPTILLAQLGRKVEELNPPIPNISHVKETGEAEQTSDTLIMPYRQDYYADQGWTLKSLIKDDKQNDIPLAQEPTDIQVGRLFIPKSRHGPTGHVDLGWDGPCTTYRNLAREYPRHYTNKGEG